MKASLKYCGILWMILAMAAPGCKQDKGDVSALRLPDSVQTRQPLSSAPKRMPANKPSSSVAGKQQTGTSSVAGTGSGDQSAATISNIPRIQGSRWWNNTSIFFADYVEGTGDLVYEVVKGQPYFEDTKIFIYATDKSMEGSYQYNKIELSMQGTELDDRIFIWVHFDDNRKPISVKKLISDNIKDKLDQAPLRIE